LSRQREPCLELGEISVEAENDIHLEGPVFSNQCRSFQVPGFSRPYQVCVDKQRRRRVLIATGFTKAPKRVDDCNRTGWISTQPMTLCESKSQILPGVGVDVEHLSDRA